MNGRNASVMLTFIEELAKAFAGGSSTRPSRHAQRPARHAVARENSLVDAVAALLRVCLLSVDAL
jgi:hypothetical protein